MCQRHSRQLVADVVGGAVPELAIVALPKGFDRAVNQHDKGVRVTCSYGNDRAAHRNWALQRRQPALNVANADFRTIPQPAARGGTEGAHGAVSQQYHAVIAPCRHLRCRCLKPPPGPCAVRHQHKCAEHRGQRRAPRATARSNMRRSRTSHLVASRSQRGGRVAGVLVLRGCRVRGAAQRGRQLTPWRGVPQASRARQRLGRHHDEHRKRREPRRCGDTEHRWPASGLQLSAWRASHATQLGWDRRGLQPRAGAMAAAAAAAHVGCSITQRWRCKGSACQLGDASAASSWPTQLGLSAAARPRGRLLAGPIGGACAKHVRAGEVRSLPEGWQRFRVGKARAAKLRRDPPGNA